MSKFENTGMPSDTMKCWEIYEHSDDLDWALYI